MKKISTFLFIVILFATFNTLNSQCLQNWTYSTPITITNSNASPLVNFQVKLTVNTDALVSAGHMQSSGNDIRFTHGSCCDYLYHTVESGMNTSATIIWVRVDSIPAGGNVTINMNYGNSSALNSDNAAATFDMWEPFDNSVNHFSPATCGTGTYTVAGGVANVSWPSQYILVSDFTFDMDTIYTLEGNVTAASGNWPGINFSKVAPDYKGYGMLLSGLSPRMGEAGTTAFDFCRGENWASAILSASSVAGVWSVTWISTGNIIGEFPTVGAMNSTSTTHTRDNDLNVCFGGISSGSGSMSLDWVRVRKYAVNTPGVSIGGETPLIFQFVSLGNDTSVCDLSGGLVIDAGGGFNSYSWSGVGSGTLQTTTLNTTGQLIVNAIDVNSCSSIDTLIVSQFPPVNVNLGIDQTICPNDTALLDAGPGFSSYTWSSGGNVQTENASSAGTYMVDVTDANGCIGSDTVIISEFPTVNVDLGADQSVCAGDTVILDAGPGFSSYSWSSGGTVQTEVVGTAGTYMVDVIDANSCTGSDTVIVSYFSPVNIDLGADQSMCLGDSIILDAGSGFTSYLWTTGGTLQTENIHSSGTYAIYVTDGNSCDGSDTIVIGLYPQPVASFTFTSVSLSTTFTNTSTGGSTYFWDFDDGNTSTNFDTVHVFTTSGTYNVCLTVINSDNCETTTCTNVTVANTGLNNELSAAGIKVYPNPAKNNVWINSMIEYDEINVLITDMLGKVIYRKPFQHLTQQSIDITTFKPGNYIIQIIVDGQYYHTPLIISE